MSKNLFNSNTFNSKNIKNSNTIEGITLNDAEVDSLTATTATIENLINSEVQANTAKVGITQTQADEITSFRETILSTGQIEIATNSAPQLLVNRSSGGGDGIVRVRGGRTNTGHETAQLYFENSNVITGNIGIFGTIVGEKTTGNNGDLGDLVFKTTSAVNSGVYTNAEAMRLTSNNTIEISASSTTLKSLLSTDASVDTTIDNKLGLVHTTAAGYTTFDGNIFLGRSSNYRPYYMGLLGDDATNSNVFCIAGVGGSGDNPDPVFAVNENGNGEFAARVTAPLFVDGGANDLRTDIDSKQPALTVGDGVNINSNTISFDPSTVTSTVNFSGTGVGVTASGDIEAGGSLKYTDTLGVVINVETELRSKQDNLTIDTAVDSVSENPVENRAVYTAISNLQSATGTALDLKQLKFEVGGTTRLTLDTSTTPNLLSVNSTNTVTLGSNDLVLGGGIFAYLLNNYNKKLTIGSNSTNQLEITSTSTSANNININDILSVKLASSASQTELGLVTGQLLDTEIGNINIPTYTAESGGGIAVNSSREISLDYTNMVNPNTIPRTTVISNANTPQLTVTQPSGSRDAVIIIEGQRTSNLGTPAQLKFQNINSNTGDSRHYFRIAGVETDNANGIGGGVFYNFPLGTDAGKVEALTMSKNGNFNMGGGLVFQDDYKLKINGNFQVTGNTSNSGNSYIKQGLILDPFDMGTTVFTNHNDTSASASSRENIYIKFAPSVDSANDWCYLRNIGGSNAGHLALDFHDDANDVRFSIRNVVSTSSPDVITEVFKVLSTGVTANTSIYRIPQMAIYNFNKTSMSSNVFGNGNRFINPNTRTTGTSFSSHSNGSVTISSNGYYKIRVGANPVTDGYNDRLAFCIYLLIGSTEYFQNQNYNFQGYTYTRNSSDGAFGNINFEDYIYISSGTIIQVRTKLDTNNRNFDDQLSNSQMECYCHLQIERIAETNI